MPLEFKRTSRFNKDKVNIKVRKDWLSTKPTRYRITWRREIFRVKVPARFQATVLCCVPGNFEGGKTEIWAFVDNSKRLFRTMKKAVEACERHSRIWEKVLQCPSIRAVKSLFEGRKPNEIPKWIYGHIDRRILSVLMDNTSHRYSEEEDDIAYFDTQSLPEPEPELVSEKKQRRKRRKVLLKDVEIAMGQPLARKVRSDKGQPRKPRKPKTMTPETITPETLDLAPVTAPPKRRGRPPGPKNNVVPVENATPPKRRGRPPGSKNRPKV